MEQTIPYRNISPHGWWIATYIERAAWDEDLYPAGTKRCLAWENTVLIQASDRETAYDKVVALGLAGTTEFSDPDTGKTGRWVFEGLLSLLPVYEELADGAEILWTEHRGRTVGKVRSWIRQKHELEAFDDRPSTDPDAKG